MQCNRVADLKVRIISQALGTFKDDVLRDIRNSVSGPRMKVAGWALHQGREECTTSRSGVAIFP